MEERPCFVAGVRSLLELFDELIPHPTHKAKRNPFMGKVGGQGLKPAKCDTRESMPWQFLQRVSEGKSAPVGFGATGVMKPANQDVLDWIEQHRFRFTGAMLMEDGHLPKI